MTNLSRRMFVKALGISMATLLTGCAKDVKTPLNGEDKTQTEKTETKTTDAEVTESTNENLITTPYAEGYDKGIHHAKLTIRDVGVVMLELDADTAPVTVSNFAHLANEGFYNGLTFHRIIKGFMVQGGDPAGDGTGGAETNIIGEFSNNGIENDISHERGTISMARATDYNSASSQFFICDADSPFLNGQYAAFGHVTDGMDVIDAIADVEVMDDNGTVEKHKQPIIDKIAMID